LLTGKIQEDAKINHLIKLNFLTSFQKILHYQISLKSAHSEQRYSMQTDGRIKITDAINTTPWKEPQYQL
jgi:hypothetical protein